MMSRTSALIVPPMKSLPEVVYPFRCALDFLRDGVVKAGIATGAEQQADIDQQVDGAQRLQDLMPGPRLGAFQPIERLLPFGLFGRVRRLRVRGFTRCVFP